LKFGSLGSGSEGNGLLVAAASGSTRTTVLIDCGFGIREAERRMARLGVQPSELAAILVTHEHTDHVGGVFRLARRHRIPVWLSHGTFEAVSGQCDGVSVHFCRDGDRIAIGDLELAPYTVPHDAREPVQYVAGDGRARLGVLTDAGQSTPHMLDALGGCDALMLEFNHDAQMLADSAYPVSLKRRIAGAWGHLSNDASAQILRALDRSRLKVVVGAHLSQKNNTPELARAALLAALGGAPTAVQVACQQQGFDWIEV
jgi:phosphoribosyl 1,2-cyclic phosphodiesterase